MWIPDTKGMYPDLLATSGDYLRVWKVGDADGRSTEARYLNNTGSFTGVYGF
jgi:WD repeat-containing protein 68